MNDKELDNYMKTVNPNFDSHIEKETIEMNNEYYNLLEEKMARLINENQLLKKQLENIEEELELVRCDLHNRTSERDGRKRELDECLSQQKEFINYLEDETKEVEKTIEMLSDTNSCRIQNLKYKGNTLKEILQKYKSIIGEK